MHEIGKPKPDLAQLVVKWQAILRLQDWDIEARYRRAFDMDDNKQGGCSWMRRLRQARVSILDPLDYSPNPRWDDVQDIEATLVHELLHIHFALVDDYQNLSLDLFEQSIEAIAQALIELHRQAEDRLTGANPK